MTVYERQLPNGLSRLLECTVFAKHFGQDTPLLVLGDLPLASPAAQTVFVHTPHLLEPSSAPFRSRSPKYAIARTVFRMNQRRVRNFIVQTDVMRDALTQSYPETAGRVHVVHQPAPEWLLASQLRRTGRVAPSTPRLSLIYPAAAYPHKNHALLQRANFLNYAWPVEKLTLTVSHDFVPYAQMAWLDCVGLLPAAQLIKQYSAVDGLLFLSLQESYGFPLVEAMHIGLPIVCPDLPYAHHLCGDLAIYFDPTSIKSLYQAVSELASRLNSGWWPDWSTQTKKFPEDWSAVAKKLLSIAFR